MNHTTYKFSWESGYTKARRLSRSFHTLPEAEKFATGKKDSDIYKSNGKYKVEWVKVINERSAGE